MKTDIIRTRIDDDLKKSFDSIMRRKGLTASKVLRNFIIDYIERENISERRDQETREALEQVKLGRVVDGDVVMSWLKTWGTDDENKLSI